MTGQGSGAVPETSRSLEEEENEDGARTVRNDSHQLEADCNNPGGDFSICGRDNDPSGELRGLCDQGTLDETSDLEQPEASGAAGPAGDADVESAGSGLADGAKLDGGAEAVESVGKPLRKPVGKSPKSASLRTPVDVPAFVGNPVGISLPDAVGKSVGIPVGKQGLCQQKQQLSRTEWYRYELDFRQIKKGCWVLIRKRLRWSDTRYSKVVVRRFCPQLSKKMIEQISVGRFSKETVAALESGGIQDGFIKALQERIGKGNGKRKVELTDFERSLLARIESSVRASGRSGDG